MAGERQEAIITLVKTPISDASPVGDPVRYEEIFENLQAEMDKIGSLTGEEPDWSAVVTLASEILKTKSKDLLVMTYLALGLFQSEGYVGLNAGLAAYKIFVKAFWEGCFPKVKPPHGRFNAIQYLADKVVPQIDLKGGQVKKQPAPNEKEAVHECVDTLAELDTAVNEAFSSQPESPNLLPMLRAFKALKQKVGPLVEETPAVPADGAPGSAPAAGAAPGAAPAAAVPQTFSSVSQASQTVIKIAKYFLQQDQKDARGYRLMRAALFGGISEAPKDRLIPGPPAPRRQFFETTAGGGDWPTLLKEAEGQFATTPLWLDMQRYVAMAAKNQGPAFKAVHDAVTLETVALRNRLPDLFDRAFKDGNAFADGATKSWLDEIAGGFGGDGGGGGAAAGDAVATAIAEARKLVGQAKAPDAVRRLADAMDGSASRRQRFRAQLALAGFCLDMKKAPLAASLLEGLELLIDEYKLEEWEPDLAASALRDLYTCRQKLKPRPTPEESQRAAALYARLCRIDPAAALKLEPAPATTARK